MEGVAEAEVMVATVAVGPMVFTERKSDTAEILQRKLNRIKLIKIVVFNFSQ